LIPPSQRGPERCACKTARQVWSRLRHDNQSGATLSTPYRGAGASRAGCGATVTDSHGALQPPRRPAARLSPARPPRLATRPRQRGPAGECGRASHPPPHPPATPLTAWLCVVGNAGATVVPAHTSGAGHPLHPTPAPSASGRRVTAQRTTPPAPTGPRGRRGPRAAGAPGPRGAFCAATSGVRRTLQGPPPRPVLGLPLLVTSGVSPICARISLESPS